MLQLLHRARRRARRLWYYRQIEQAVSGKRGLEIGGPSAVFTQEQQNGYIPAIYEFAATIDNCNFASVTTWSHGEYGRTFKYHPNFEPGMQYIDDATGLTSIADNTYDFLLASHILEHVANPLRALEEFRRVLKPKGAILVILPNQLYTFDHRRPLTTMAHLEEDWLAHRGEDDMTHLDEILTLHDLSMDPLAGTPQALRERSLRNAENRCLHQHVFSLEVMEKAFRKAGLRPVYSSQLLVPHLLTFGYKR